MGYIGNKIGTQCFGAGKLNSHLVNGISNLVEAGFSGEILHGRDPDRKIAGHDPLCGVGDNLNRPGHSQFPPQIVDGSKEYRQ